jgi:hypothetical protein
MYKLHRAHKSSEMAWFECGVNCSRPVSSYNCLPAKKQQHDKRSSEPYCSNSRAALDSHEALHLPLQALASSIALEGWVVVVLVDGGWHGVVGSQHQHNRTENHHSALSFDVCTMLAGNMNLHLIAQITPGTSVTDNKHASCVCLHSRLTVCFLLLNT